MTAFIPVPDYKYFQDQAEEIDVLTARIASLTDSEVGWLLSFGADGQVSNAIEKALNPKTENEMIGVASWAAFSSAAAPRWLNT